ncbi:MAG: RNB domain-containing ribonuclease [Deltaproteobacteria bacterium]|nr:RNB domain-containing ribonuclease [Deltaproteobacteria bacterium]
MSEPGRIVEFIEERGFITAVVTRVKGPKLLVLSETDREMNISANRVLHETKPGLDTSLPRLDLVRALKDISRRRIELCQSINYEELWALLDGEGEEFTYGYLAELAWPGPAGPDRVAAILRAVFADGLYFKMRPGSAQRHNPEIIDQILRSRAKESEKEKELIEGSEWIARVWTGDFSDEPGFGKRIIKILKEMAINGEEAPESKWGWKILERAGLGNDPWHPFQILVKLGEMHINENLDLIRHDVPINFSAEVRAEAESVAKLRAWRNQTRLDLTHLEVITADSGGARDFDDAVSLEIKNGKCMLGVHIADVSAVIHPGSLLDQTGQERATSIYMPDQRIPMLPEVLSEECLSLKEGEIRPAFSLLVELTETGEVVNYEFTPSLVTVKRQLSYQEVDIAVNHDLILGRMFKISQGLKAKRLSQGAMILPLPKLNVYLTPEGEIGVNLTLWENPGRAMISEFMILANYLAADFLQRSGATCYYRSQGAPSEIIVPGDTDCTDLFPCLKQRRYLDRVHWGTTPLPHYMMGLPLYTNLTSPLRRYIDLIIQRQVRSVVAGGPPLYLKEEMDAILTLIEETRRRANILQNNRRRYWLLRYLEGPGRKNYEALVLERFPHKWKIFLTEIMLDADLPIRSGQHLELGETITVRIKKIDARQDILKFDLA